MLKTKGKSKTWSAIFIVLIVMVILVAACGGNNQPVEQAAQSDQKVTAAPAAQPKQEASEPKEEASKSKEEPSNPSGKVVVYTAGPAGLADAILAGFEAETGVKVEQFQGTTGKVLARLEAEKSNPLADIVVLASWPSGMEMVQNGWTQSYPSASNADLLHGTWIDADRHLFGYSASALGIAYNTKLVSAPPADWSDLADAQWKDAVNIPDPTLSGSALDFISGYLNEKGEDGWSMFEALKQNGVAMAGANKEALDPVITGAKSAVLAGVDYMAYSAKAKGEPVDILYPESGTVINPRPAMIMKESPNLDNARLFIDYLLSDEAQQHVANAYLLPGRTDIPAKDRAEAADIKLLQYDWTWMMDNGEEITNQFMGIFK